MASIIKIGLKVQKCLIEMKNEFIKWRSMSSKSKKRWYISIYLYTLNFFDKIRIKLHRTVFNRRKLKRLLPLLLQCVQTVDPILSLERVNFHADLLFFTSTVVACTKDFIGTISILEKLVEIKTENLHGIVMKYVQQKVWKYWVTKYQ